MKERHELPKIETCCVRDVKLGPGVHASGTNVICVHSLIRGIDHGACSSLLAIADEAYAPARARLSENRRNLRLDAMIGGSSGNTWGLGSKVAISMQGTDPGAHFQISCIKDFAKAQRRLVSGLL